MNLIILLFSGFQANLQLCQKRERQHWNDFCFVEEGDCEEGEEHDEDQKEGGLLLFGLAQLRLGNTVVAKVSLNVALAFLHLYFSRLAPGDWRGCES